MIRLVAIDLDGTLLPEEQIVPLKTKKVIQKLVEKGIYVVIASGRSSFSVENIQEQVGILGQPIIMLNGVMVKYNDVTKIVKGIPADVMYDSYHFCNDRGYNFSAVFGNSELTIANNNDEFTQFAHRKYNLVPEILTVKTLEEIIELSKDQNELVKINIMDKDTKVIDRAMIEAEAEFGSRANVMQTGPWYIDYAPLGVDKGSALNVLMNELGLKREETMAIGDSGNDFMMLKEAGTAVAVSNALDSIKEIADYVTENDNEHEGVREVLEKLILQ
jgi:hypothetical protein